ncbi:PREDICTED: transmembrane protein 202 [Myotis davidii]|uniref:transmembrane protein 202 n=1 Tax=Myotis davidii TaxID=225400 RepID=UPI0003EBC4D8|nr:PREDICTED: transmembrane protein 202 [Myotis davidii]
MAAGSWAVSKGCVGGSVDEFLDEAALPFKMAWFRARVPQPQKCPCNDYLQYSRAFFLISVLTILISLGWLLSSCLPRRGSMTTNLDLKVSMLSFISAICLLFCLILFLAQVHWHTRDAMESDLLWAYYLNWWSDFLYMFSGIISFLNYITFRSPPLDQNVTVIPTERSRLGIGPVTIVSPAEDEESRSEMESPSDGEEKLSNAELSNTELSNTEM